MANKLPIKLTKEPLIEAVFEMRFSSTQPASLLIGYLFSKIDGKKQVEELPSAQLPKAIRDSNPDLQYSPTHRIVTDKFGIAFSDRSIVINTQYPYPGWAEYKPMIIQLVSHLTEAAIIQTVERFSLKYLDLIVAETIEGQINQANLSLTIANHRLTKENFKIRMDIERDGFANLVEMSSGARVTIPNQFDEEGMILTVDTISNLGSAEIATVLVNFEASLEKAHHTNKSIFFDCLKPSTVESLGPIYD